MNIQPSVPSNNFHKTFGVMKSLATNQGFLPKKLHKPTKIKTTKKQYPDYTNCYGLRITDSLMEPEVYSGEMVIFDLKRKPKNGQFVVVYKKGSREAMLKKYVVDGSNRYLESNQDDIPRLNIDESIEIIGVVVRIQPPMRLV